jgi:Fe-S protein assembly chaperone HscA
MGNVVGIDLGTTNSLVAHATNGRPAVIRDNSGDALVPSVVSISETEALIVGREAQRRLLTAPDRTVYSVKRFMGRGIDDVQDEAALLPFSVGGEAGGVVRLGVAGLKFTPLEISAAVLRELKRRAEVHFKEVGVFDFEVDRAVITVPAYFNDAQRIATRDAGRLAGLEVLRIINEPTAAALAYGLDKRDRGTIAVYDFGGGTFDISILRVEDGVFQVLATGGDTHLGGDDIDRLLTKMVLEELGGVDGSERMSLETVQAIRKAVIAAKWDLSEARATEIRVKEMRGLPAGYRKRFTRQDLEKHIQFLVDQTLEACRGALADAEIKSGDVDEIVLVGGSTRIPLVREQVEALFGRRPHSELNPDEVVALGAAVQADILVSGRREMLLLDVTPLSLGIETMGGVVSKIIMRNTTIPASGREMFTTFADDQTAVDIHVLQGERELVDDCRSLARFRLRGIPPMPAGLARVEVRFQIDADGILSVGARELRTEVDQTIEVKPSYGLTDEEVERMLLDSFDHAEDDIEVRLLIEARNEAELVVHATEKLLRRPDFTELATKELEAGESQRIEQALAAMQVAMGGNDRQSIESSMKALDEETRHLAEIVVNQTVREALTGKSVSEL